MDDLVALPESVEREQRKPLEYIQRTFPEVELLATAHSGAQGLFALTDTQLVFAWKAAGLGGLKSLIRDRAAVVAAQIDGDDLLVRDATQVFRFKNVSPPQRCVAAAEQLHASGAGVSVLQQSGPARSALRIIPEKTRRIVEQMLRPDENVHVVFVGAGGQAMIAADDRMLVVKKGMMAGATFGSKSLDFPYDQITGIELHTGAMTGYLQIQSAAFQANLPGSYWSSDKQHDPWKLPNCIAVNRSAAAKFQPTLALVRERIARGYWSDGVGQPPPPNAADEMKQPSGETSLSSELSDPAGALRDRDRFAACRPRTTET